MASAVRGGSDLIGRLARIGSLPDDSPDEALKKQDAPPSCVHDHRAVGRLGPYLPSIDLILPGSGATFLLTGMKRALD
jgi:hypothetical protein